MYAFIVFAMGSACCGTTNFTLIYIAKIPTWSRFVAAATQVELQPPFPYLLSRMVDVGAWRQQSGRAHA